MEIQYRDPIHGDIIIPKWVEQLIDTPEFQRLRRIKQLGGSSMVFAGAVHNRFAHSIGVFNIIQLIKQNVNTGKELVSSAEWKEVMAAGLLHDLGHGPLSHALEHITDHAVCHERMSQRIIKSKTTNINRVLKKNGVNPDNVAKIIAGTHKNKILVTLISSQIDADRMDYLKRDSYYTGTAYGNYDMQRIISSMRFKKGAVVFKESAIPAIENFLVARMHSFEQIYNHRVSNCYEVLYKLFFKRVVKVKGDEYDFIAPLFNKTIKLDYYLGLDDVTLNAWVYNATKSKDEITKQLALRIVNRDLFAIEKFNTAKLAAAKRAMRKDGIDATYFSGEIKTNTSGYSVKTNKHKDIQIVTKTNMTPKRLHDVSELGRSLQESRATKLMFFPKKYAK